MTYHLNSDAGISKTWIESTTHAPAISMDEPASEEALAVLVENHRKFLAFLQRRVGSLEDAEEILQSAFVRSLERGGSIADDESAVAWFYRLLRNALIDHYRHRDVELRAMEREALLTFDSEEANPEVEQALCQCVDDLLPTLNETYANLLRRVDLEGASIAEVAESTGMTPNNTRVKLHRARAALRKKLRLSCGTCTEHACLDCTCDRAPSPS